MRRVFWELFLLGLIGGLLHLGLSLQVNLRLIHYERYLNFILIFFLPINMALLGLGAKIKNKTKDLTPWTFLLFGGWFVFDHLYPFIFANYTSLFLWGFISLLLLAPAFIILGNSIFIRLKKAQNENVLLTGMGYDFLGVACGYLLSFIMVRTVGANTLFLLIPLLALIFLKRSLALFSLVLVIVSLVTPLEKKLEAFRNVDSFKEQGFVTVDNGEAYKEKENFENLKSYSDPVYQRWSERGLLSLYPTQIKFPFFVGTYNYQSIWRFNKERVDEAFHPIRRVLFEKLDGAQDVLMIGVGGGSSSGIFKSGKGLHLIERTPFAFEYFKTLPKWKEHFKDVKTYEGNARYFLKRFQKKFDVIIVESALRPKGATSTSAVVAFSLYTKEGIEEYLKLLKPNGVLVIEMSRFKGFGNRTLSSMGVLQNLKSLGIPYTSIATKKSISLFYQRFSRSAILIGKNQELLNQVKSELHQTYPETFTDISYKRSVPACIQKGFDDNQPYLVWNCRGKYNWAKYLLILLFLLPFLWALIKVKRTGEGQRLQSLIIGFLQSSALTFLVFKFQFTFMEEVKGSLLLFGFYNLGIALYCYYFSKKKIHLGLLTPVLILGLYFYSFNSIESLPLNLFMGALLFTGLGVSLGGLFPFYMEKLKEEGMGTFFLLDSFVLFCGFALSIFLVLEFGFSASLIILLAFSLLSLWKLGWSGASQKPL